MPPALTLNAVAPLLAGMDAWRQPGLIRSPLQLHYSDQDHHSPPGWNEPLVQAVNAAGGLAEGHLYASDNYRFEVEPGWSPAGSVPGRGCSIERALAYLR